MTSSQRKISTTTKKQNTGAKENYERKVQALDLINGIAAGQVGQGAILNIAFNYGDCTIEYKNK